MEKIRKQIISLINRSKSILLMPSTPVDGDSLGSSLALYLVLKKLGKEVTVVCADPVPEAFEFLPTTKVIDSEFSGSEDFIVTLDCHKSKINTIKTKLENDKVNIIITAKRGRFTAKDVSFHHGPSKYDLIITVDTADLQQLGRFYEDNTGLFTQIPVINIDHHSSNENFGKINLVDVMASATTELIIPLIKDMEEDTGKKLMDEDTATLLLAGIITDTGSFQNANTTPRSFAAAAELIKYGARQQEIIQHVFKTKHLSTLRLWGRILSKINVDTKHKMVWSTLTRRDFEETNSRPDETGGIIDELLTNAPDAEIVLLLKDKGDGIISGSLRTTSPVVDASEVAEMFGGGGHTRAAGFKIKSENFEQTENIVIGKIREYQSERLNIKEEETVTEEQEEQIEETTPVEPTEPMEKEQETQESTVKPDEKPEEVTTQTKIKKKQSVEKKTPTKPVEEEETFTDLIIKKSAKEESSETEIEPELTYKFED